MADGGALAAPRVSPEHRATAAFNDDDFSALLGYSDGYALSGWLRACVCIALGLPLGRRPHTASDSPLYTSGRVQCMLAAAEWAALRAAQPNQLKRGEWLTRTALDPELAARVREAIERLG